MTAIKTQAITRTISLWEIEGISCYFELMQGFYEGMIISTDNLYFLTSMLLDDGRLIFIWRCSLTGALVSDLARIKVYYEENES